MLFQKNTKPKCCIFCAVVNRQFVYSLVKDKFSSYYKVCAPSLSSSTSSVTPVFNQSLLSLSITLSWSINPLSYNSNPISWSIGFPLHLSCFLVLFFFFAQAAELKSVNNVIIGSKYIFPLILLSYKLTNIASL